jgi:hypothetical protein
VVALHLRVRHILHTLSVSKKYVSPFYQINTIINVFVLYMFFSKFIIIYLNIDIKISASISLITSLIFQVRLA